MPDVKRVIAVIEETRRLLEAPGNDFSWSSWEDRDEALAEIDSIRFGLRSGVAPASLGLELLFAPTGPIQEVSIGSGWADAFIELAGRFDDAMASDPGASSECGCQLAPPRGLRHVKDLGADRHGAEVRLLSCGECGRWWLEYHYEAEGFSRSGQWYLGAISPEQASALTAGQAREILEGLGWYYYGGSYYDGRRGRSSGKITSIP